jgi:hypothetical protein
LTRTKQIVETCRARCDPYRLEAKSRGEHVLYALHKPSHTDSRCSLFPISTLLLFLFPHSTLLIFCLASTSRSCTRKTNRIVHHTTLPQKDTTTPGMSFLICTTPVSRLYLRFVHVRLPSCMSETARFDFQSHGQLCSDIAIRRMGAPETFSTCYYYFVDSLSHRHVIASLLTPVAFPASRNYPFNFPTS